MEKNNLFETIPMTGVKNIIVVASGKGGVGKSTLAAQVMEAIAVDSGMGN